jgi:hypothetical protein
VGTYHRCGAEGVRVGSQRRNLLLADLSEDISRSVRRHE